MVVCSANSQAKFDWKSDFNGRFEHIVALLLINSLVNVAATFTGIHHKKCFLQRNAATFGKFTCKELP